MRVILILLLAALGACVTTPAALGTASPGPTYMSVKQPKVIADCLQHAIGPVSLL